MKKYLFLLGLMTMGLTFTSCSSNDDDPKGGEETTMPEGTDDPRVTIEETDANYADYATNWCLYASAVSLRLMNDAETLYKAWKEGLDDDEAYQTTFKEVKGAYHSPNDCIEQIIDGCIDIANEVGESKIGDPRDKWEQGKYTEAVYAVESWYSYHSITDYANNIRSIQNAFCCTYNNKSGEHSIEKYLKANGQTALAEQVSNAITTAITSIEGMATPFRSHIGSTTVPTAMEACDNLKTILKTLKAKVEDFEGDEELTAVVANYVDVVVLPTYQDLATANAALHAAVTALAAAPSNATFEAAAQAWMNARTPWESSEAFLFGPVDELGLDPNMDSWPLDQAQILEILKTQDFSSLNWSGEYNEDDAKIEDAQTIRGFHTLEFLIFKDGKARTVK